jgi:hypothetical protein
VEGVEDEFVTAKRGDTGSRGRKGGGKSGTTSGRKVRGQSKSKAGRSVWSKSKGWDFVEDGKMAPKCPALEFLPINKIENKSRLL